MTLYLFTSGYEEIVRNHKPLFRSILMQDSSLNLLSFERIEGRRVGFFLRRGTELVRRDNVQERIQ